jgi:two-component system sensor histidine kinase EvgS
LYKNSMQAPAVLAVDDHPVNRNLLARQLGLLGMQVVTAEDGRKALSLWQSGRFAFVITDCHMPELDGYGLSKVIRDTERAEGRPHTTIIAWTANALGDEYKICMDAGMDELLVKPNNLIQLKNVLAKYAYPEVSSQPSKSQASVGQPQDTLIDTADADIGAAHIINFAKFSQVVPDPAEHLQVLQDFREYMGLDCAELCRLQEQADFDAIQAGAHRMKGSCRMVGAEPLASACLALELAAKNANSDGVQSAYQHLAQTYAQFVLYLDILNSRALNESKV